MSDKPNPCCVPSKERAALLMLSQDVSAGRLRATSGSTARMIRLDGGLFLMGTDSPEGFPADGEGPIRKIRLNPFYMDTHAVSNEAFREFAAATAYKTEAERYGWSFVFKGHISDQDYTRLVEDTVYAAPWWCKVKGADLASPRRPRFQHRGASELSCRACLVAGRLSLCKLGREEAADRSRVGICGARWPRAEDLSLG